MLNNLNGQIVLEALKPLMLAFRTICLFFIPQSIEPLHMLSNASIVEEDELDLAKQYSMLWDKSAELLPPFTALLKTTIKIGAACKHCTSVQHASRALIELGFIAVVGFTQILKACQYSVLDKVASFVKSNNHDFRNTQLTIGSCVFFFAMKMRFLSVLLLFDASDKTRQCL
ncbi:hypothetical protein OTK51_14170 [Vibrio scophthalmi]|uniref:hypothetical protein n=1 Tax=Vibrio scophthalmi TaxID=45658 RepID=UPI002284E8D4|nr:hypothetical protein [Vibrio scophthalmi]MCY9804576.1 hypothetical protein [Vibrio scophthalmi]